MSSALTRKLLNWFNTGKRDLPWRHHHTPYSVWISEIMLQQTVVNAVIPYFEKWMKKFPTVESLAVTSEREVMICWEGLGYYSRARNIHKAARRIVEKFNGKIPDDYESLLSLPGIGDYTASAILSIAYERPYAVVDANVRRVVSRLLALTRPGQQIEKNVREFLNSHISKKYPGDFNEALMELGQTICNSSNPRCEVCPLSNHCIAFAGRIQNSIPPRKSLSTIKLESVVLLILQGNRILASQQKEGLFAGLWVLPKVKAGIRQESGIAAFIRDRTGSSSTSFSPLSPRVHHYTKYAEKLNPRLYEVTSLKPTKKTVSPWRWLSVSNLQNYPFSSTDRKIIHELKSLHSTIALKSTRKRSKISV